MRSNSSAQTSDRFNDMKNIIIMRIQLDDWEANGTALRSRNESASDTIHYRSAQWWLEMWYVRRLRKQERRFGAHSVGRWSSDLAKCERSHCVNNWLRKLAVSESRENMCSNITADDHLSTAIEWFSGANHRSNFEDALIEIPLCKCFALSL